MALRTARPGAPASMRSSARPGGGVVSTSRSERERTRTNSYDLHNTKEVHKFLRPLEKHTHGRHAKDPRQMGACTNATGEMKTGRIRDRHGYPVIRPRARGGVPLTERTWNALETERTFVTESMELYRGGRETPNMWDRRKQNQFQITEHERDWKIGATAGVRGEPGRDCCDSLTLQAALKMANKNTLYRK